jgi:hypothetical protein
MDYAPIMQTLNNQTHKESGSSKSYGTLNTSLYPSNTNFEINSDPYNVSEHYYVEFMMKEFQAKPTKVASEYFSVTNIKRIQKKIKKEIKKRSYNKFILEEDQQVNDLLQMMMAVFKLYSRNLPYKIKRQVKALNERTVQYVAPDILDNLKQYYGYLDDIKNPINPIDRPINVSNAGRKTLPSVAQLYGL